VGSEGVLLHAHVKMSKSKDIQMCTGLERVQLELTKLCKDISNR
jgi:hypothetical protein